jgi:hypothetical protein
MGWRDFQTSLHVENVENIQEASGQCSLIPLLPLIPPAVNLDSAVTNVQPFTNQVQAAMTFDEVWTIIGTVRDADVSLQGKHEFWQACILILAKFYEAIPNDDLVNSKPATVNECIAIEWHRRGWFQYRQRK